mgnify:CR=1 FL=1
MLHYSQTGRKQSWTGRPVLRYDKLLDFLFVHSSTNMTKQTNHRLLPIHGSTHNTSMKSSRSTIAELYFSRRVLSIYFFLIFAQLWEFGGWGFGVGVSDWVFGLGVFSWCGLGLCCGAFWVLWVWALYINIEEYPWEKNFAWWGAQDLASLTAPITNHCSRLTGQIIDRVFTSQVMMRSSS